MSWMASSASLRSASGSTLRNVRPSASKVETPSEVTSRYGVVSSPRGSRSVYANAGLGGRGAIDMTAVILTRQTALTTNLAAQSTSVGRPWEEWSVR